MFVLLHEKELDNDGGIPDCGGFPNANESVNVIDDTMKMILALDQGIGFRTCRIQ